jgi:hypothetical protein
MLVVAAILLANVLIWTLPYSSGGSPAEKAQALCR